MPLADFTSLTHVAEAVPGEVPAGAVMTDFPKGTADMPPTMNFEEQGVARSDGLDTEDDFVGIEAALTFQRPFQQNVFDFMFEEVLGTRWVTQNNRFNELRTDDVTSALTAYRGITNVDALNGEYVTLGSDADTNPLAAFNEHDLVWASGFTKTVNNGLKKALAASSATALAVAETLADEPSRFGQTLRVVGRAFPADDLSVQGDAISGFRLVSASGFDFSTVTGKGRYIKIGGDATANNFTTIYCNDAVKVTDTTTAGECGITNTTVGFAADTGSSKEIYVFWDEYVLPGQDSFTRTWQGLFRNDHIRRITGTETMQFTISGQAKSRYQVNAQLMGRAWEPYYTPADDLRGPLGGENYSNLFLPENRSTISAAGGGHRIFINGVYDWERLCIRSTDMVFNANKVGIDVEGCEGLKGHDGRRLQFSLDGTYHFADNKLFQLYHERKFFDFTRVMAGDRGGYVIQVPRMQLRSHDGSLPGPGQQIIPNVSGKATADDIRKSQGEANYFLMVSRFQYAEGFRKIC